MTTQKNPIADITTRFINSTSRHIFLTGKAGTGKTTFLRHITKITHKNTVVAAPTGIAAINAEGVTLHSLFQLPFGAFVPANVALPPHLDFQVNTPQSITRAVKMNRTKRNMLQEIELLVIDEVSMLRADVLDAIDVILRSIRKQHQVSFGGVQVLFIGDLLQLPPIVRPHEQDLLSDFYEDMFFFNAKVLEHEPPLYIELEKIYRQSDPVFISLLNRLREDNLRKADIDYLNNYCRPDFNPGKKDGYIFLTTHNAAADKINKGTLKKLKTPSCFFSAGITGDFGEHLYPVDEALELKKGAQVMFIKNDYSGKRRYFNGKIGHVVKLDKGRITVSFQDGSPDTDVDPYIWENKRYTLDKETNEIEEKVIGTFSQYPLKVAWAVTVHKSQGLTFDKAVIDVSRAFAPGQIYVALSRLTSLDGLVLSAPIPVKGFTLSRSLQTFSRNKKDSGTLDTELRQYAHGYTVDTVLKAFSFDGLLRLVSYHVNSYHKDEKKSAKQQYKEWALALLRDTQPIKDVADKFVNQLQRITSNHAEGQMMILHKRLIAAKAYFEPLLREMSDRIQDHMAPLKGKKGLKTYVNELKDLERLYFKQLKQIYKAEAIVGAALKNDCITRESFKQSGLYEGREAPSEKAGKSVCTETKTRDKPSEAPKPNTRDISFDLFQQGKEIAEIATERGLVVRTIESHLAYFVREGRLDVHQFLDKGQLQEIMKKADELDTTFLKPLKDSLGDKYSYSELKMAMAHYQRVLSE